MKHVLIVEDEFIIASHISNYLTKLGHKVTLGATEDWKIIESVKHNQFDLILMNVKLQSGLDGIDIMTKIRTFSSIPVIYVTSASDESTRKRAKKTSPVEYIVKPFEFSDLKKAIERGWKSSLDT